MVKDEYRKHFIPLESNPEVFTKLIHELGVSDTFSFVDIWALDCVEHVPRPAAALVLVLPTSTEYEQRKSIEDAERQEDSGARGDGVIWLPQTINNACGLYAILHAACNGDARLSIRPGSLLARFIASFQTQQPRDCAKLLEDSTELESTYNKAAMQGDSLVPTDAQEEVDFHYVCFVKTEDCRIYELDGDRKGAIDRGVILAAEDDMLSRASLNLVQDCIDRERGENIGFSLMALVQSHSLLQSVPE